MFNVVSILLGQHYTGKNFLQCCLFIVVLILLGQPCTDKMFRMIFSISDNPSQKITEVTSRDQEASLILPTTETEGAWKLVKKL